MTVWRRFRALPGSDQFFTYLLLTLAALAVIRSEHDE